MPVPFLEPGQSPESSTIGGPVPAFVENALIKHTKGAIDVLQGLQHQWECLAQDIEKDERE